MSLDVFGIPEVTQENMLQGMIDALRNSKA